ncbi:hypothetical protein [Desertivirga arenae]|uniref:hypothetical protein n=1 Tax=Desertivirga arenae TaxID=2810309 RepID=UPI001A9680CE|nr:hypothetical protein [Pedobacter sp. SYSU D00823]
MNYILHLNGFYRKANDDENMGPCHLSLYWAIFQIWNAFYFQNPFPVIRSELMRKAKIGSKNTYYRCLHELHEWGYIDYAPSHNRAVPCHITCVLFDSSGTGNGTGSRRTYDTTTGPTFCTPLVPELNPFIKLNKTFINTLSLKNIKKFFEENSSNAKEATNFYNHYQANGWMMGQVQMVDWEAAARKWIAGAGRFAKNNTHKTNRSAKIISIHNSTPKTLKRYDEPL